MLIKVVKDITPFEQLFLLLEKYYHGLLYNVTLNFFNSKVFVVTEGEKIIAFAQITKDLLNSFCVLPSYRKTGVGRKLLATIFSEYIYIYLEPFDDNAYNFFIKVGAKGTKNFLTLNRDDFL